MTNLLIPADMVRSLQIPDVTVSTGEPGGVCCDRTWGLTRWSRRYVVRLPYDVRAAATLRKRAVLNRVYAVFLPAFVLAVSWFWFRLNQDPAPRPWPLVMNVGLIALSVLDGRWNASPKPSRTRRGDLYLLALPPAVAHLWLESNPGVQAVDREPTYRRWPPWVYAAGAFLCAAGAFGLLGWVFSGDEVPGPVLFVLPVVVGAGLGLAYLALPTGHTRLRSGN